MVYCLKMCEGRMRWKRIHPSNPGADVSSARAGTVYPLPFPTSRRLSESEASLFIYALCEPDTGEVRYVGKADNPQERLRNHLSACKLRDNTHKNAWLKLLLRQQKKPHLLILEQVTGRSWQEAEREWIARYEAQGARLTNGAPGGNGGVAPEAREKLRLINLGKKYGPRSVETRAKISAAKRGRTHHSPATREKLRAYMTGRTLSAEIRQAMSAARVGRIVTPETRAKLSAARKARGLGNYPVPARNLTPEQRQKRRERMLGTHPTPETRAKLRAAKIKDTCPRGHPFTPENTYTRPDGKGRQCRICRYERGRQKGSNQGA